MSSLNHKQQAFDLMLSQYQNSPNFIGMINSYLSISQDIEDSAQTLFDKFDINTTNGDFLDAIGQLLGIDRFPVISNDNKFFQFDVSPLDEGYRFFDGEGTPYSVIDDIFYARALKARTITMNSVGTVNELILSIAYLFDLPVADVTIKAFKRFQFDVTPLDNEFTLDWNYNIVRIDVDTTISVEELSMYTYESPPPSRSKLWAKVAGVKYELWDNTGFVI